ncbi:MAG: hypothetical protein E7478_02415 [Ruminococcaceae bacterium]|nr:hypothetical protein [Oscillospiraceae bacterium]
MYNIVLDDDQFAFILNRCVSIIGLNNDPENDLIECGKIIHIKNGDRAIIAELYKKYNSVKDIQAAEMELCSPLVTNCSDECILIKVAVYQTKDTKVTALIPATLLLYRNIQWLRHLQIKKRSFRHFLAEDTKNKFDIKIRVMEQTIDFLNGDTAIDALFDMLSYDKDDNYNLNDIIELFNVYPDSPDLNSFRKERLDEISVVISQIKELYRNGKYHEIQQAAYDIHNVPEIIRTMIDYRKERD